MFSLIWPESEGGDPAFLLSLSLPLVQKFPLPDLALCLAVSARVLTKGAGAEHEDKSSEVYGW